MQRSVFFVAYGSCTISCSLRLNVSLLILFLVLSVSESRSSASTSSSLFILTEVDLCNKPAFDRADSRLKYQAICCSINQSVLYNISSRCRLVNSKFGKPHQRRLTSYQFPLLFGTLLGNTSLLFAFSKGPIQSGPPGQYGVVRQNFCPRSDIERSHPLQIGKPPSISSLPYQRWIFFSASICVGPCKGAFGSQ